MFDEVYEVLGEYVRSEVERVLRLQLQPRYGNVVEWDAKKHVAKVKLQPDGIVSNWLPVQTHWIGAGWGMVAALNKGDQVKVVYPEYGSNQGIITGRHFDERNPPPTKIGDQEQVAESEFWLVHKDGGYLKFRTEGKHIELNAVEGALCKIGNLKEDVVKLVREEFKDLFNGHKHKDVQIGSGTSGVPTEEMTDKHLTKVLKGN